MELRKCPTTNVIVSLIGRVHPGSDQELVHRESVATSGVVGVPVHQSLSWCEANTHGCALCSSRRYPEGQSRAATQNCLLHAAGLDMRASSHSWPPYHPGLCPPPPPLIEREIFIVNSYCLAASGVISSPDQQRYQHRLGSGPVG